MRRLESYRRLAPFSMRELVESANSLLRGKPHLQVSERTVRFYISEGVLPPPEGPPRFSRYSFAHLAALIAVRFFQDQGVSLSRASEEAQAIWRGNDEKLIALIEAWLVHDTSPAIEETMDLTGFQSPPRPPMVAEVPRPFREQERIPRTRSWSNRLEESRRALGLEERLLALCEEHARLMHETRDHAELMKKALERIEQALEDVESRRSDEAIARIPLTPEATLYVRGRDVVESMRAALVELKRMLD